MRLWCNPREIEGLEIILLTFRAALASCQALYVPAGLYTLRSSEPSGRFPPPPKPPQRVELDDDSAAQVQGYCPTDGKNCEYSANCTCPPGDGPPFDMAAGTKRPGCMACHEFLSPAAAFLDWSSPAV